jgi:AcrR family transcriptional regulator
MSRIADRPYRSKLREQQAEQTRDRILDATGRVMGRGVAFVSIPDVAREAGVSVPTVYRHFATKRDLFGAVYAYAVRRSGLDELVMPRSMDELLSGLRAYFERTDSFSDLDRAAMASPAAQEVRRINMPERVALFNRMADTIEPKPSKSDRDRIARLLVILTASSSVRLWRDQLGSSVEEAADDVDWAIRALIASATSRKRS